MGYYDYKNKNTKLKSKNYKNNNKDSLDSYINENINKNWWSYGKKEEISKEQEDLLEQNEFLEKNIKTSEVIPDSMKKSKIGTVQDNMGYFKTRFGTISVGYKKYNKKTDLIFSVIPEDVKEKNSIKSYDIDNYKCYLNTEYKYNKRRFKWSKLSFKYDSSTGDISRLDKENVNKNNIYNYDDESNLLYQDEIEEQKINNLLNNNKIDNKKLEKTKKINLLKNIKDEKQEDNLDFEKELKSFINKFKKDKLKKLLDSDEVVSRSQRILNLDIDLILIKKRKELLENMFNVNLDFLSLEKINNIFEELILGILEKIS